MSKNKIFGTECVQERIINNNLYVGYKQENLVLLHEQFIHCVNYEEKVAFFDKEFDVFPFPFPVFDFIISWFDDHQKLQQYLDILKRERSRVENFYEKKFSLNNKAVRFDIKPQTISQRTYFNNYVVAKFVRTQSIFFAELNREIAQMNDPILFLEEKIKDLDNLLLWVKQKLETSSKASLKLQFLTLFLKGYSAFQNGSDYTIGVRKKFIELHFYSQGLLFAECRKFLSEKLYEFQKYRLKYSFSLRLKIALLSRLGLIDHLKQRYQQIITNKPKEGLAKFLCFILSENESKQQEVLNILDLQTDISEILTEEELNALKQKLKDFHLE